MNRKILLMMLMVCLLAFAVVSWATEGTVRTAETNRTAMDAVVVDATIVLRSETILATGAFVATYDEAQSQANVREVTEEVFTVYETTAINANANTSADKNTTMTDHDAVRQSGAAEENPLDATVIQVAEATNYRTNFFVA